MLLAKKNFKFHARVQKCHFGNFSIFPKRHFITCAWTRAIKARVWFLTWWVRTRDFLVCIWENSSLIHNYLSQQKVAWNMLNDLCVHIDKNVLLPQSKLFSTWFIHFMLFYGCVKHILLPNVIMYIHTK